MALTHHRHNYARAGPKNSFNDGALGRHSTLSREKIDVVIWRQIVPDWLFRNIEHKVGET
jgi:hypothetical protein